MKVDYLIVGQGLAGSALALALLQKGASVAVIDREQQDSASRVAAGLVTPLGGQRVNLSWRQEQYLPEAIRHYRQLENASGQRLFHQIQSLKLFNNEQQRAKFESKKEHLRSWWSEPKHEDLKHWSSTHGGIMMPHGGWLDTQAYIATVQKILGNAYSVRTFNETLLKTQHNRIQYEEITAKAAILCLGAESFAEPNKLFSFLNHRNAKGEMLEVQIPSQPEKWIIQKNGWLLPKGNHRYKVGATYNWDDLTSNVTTEGKTQVESILQNILGNSNYTILKHTAGVRPILRKSRPLVGNHPELPPIKVFNGLGSKGVMTAPSVAAHFADHLVNGTLIDPELDIANHQFSIANK